MTAVVALAIPPAFAGSMSAPTFGNLDPKMFQTPSESDLPAILRLIESGQLEAAHKQADTFVGSHPDSAPGHELRGVARSLTGNLEGGLADFKKALEIEPARSTAMTKIGDILMAKNDLAGAKTRFSQALALNPEDRRAHQRMGIIAEEEEDIPAAIGHYEKGIVGTPQIYSGVKVSLGRLYNQNKRFADTILLLDPVIEAGSQDDSVRLVLATALIACGKSERAVELLEKCADTPGTTREGILLASGIAYRDAGQAEKSRECLDKALQLKPDWQAARFQLAETLVALKRLPDALETYKESIAGAPDPVWIRIRMAESCAGNGCSDQAIGIYQSLIGEGVGTVRTYLGFATVLQLADRLKEAEELLLAASKKFPDKVPVLQRLGMHYALVRDYPRATAELEKANALSPADPAIHKAISLVALRRGDTGAAIEWAKKLLVLAPDSTEDRFYLATLLEVAGNRQDAAGVYAEILKSSPEHVGSLNNLANLKLREGDTASALQLATEAARLAPNVPSVRNTLGWVKFKTGDPAGARIDLAAALAVDNPSPSHRYQLAVVLAASGDKKAAGDQLDLALASEISFPEREDAVHLSLQLEPGKAGKNAPR
jgi:tetratricopeptide (TPR) repeat protein